MMTAADAWLVLLLLPDDSQLGLLLIYVGATGSLMWHWPSLLPQRRPHRCDRR
jgi:hypothetical protein